MFADDNKPLRALLEASGLVAAGQLAELEARGVKSGQTLWETVLATGSVSEEALFSAISAHLGIASVALPATIGPELLGRISSMTAHRFGVIPVEAEGSLIRVAAVNPLRAQLVDDLTFALNCPVELVLCDPDAVRQLLEASYPQTAPFDRSEGRTTDAPVKETRAAEQADPDPVVRLVDLMLSQAVRDRASDVHFEPFESTFRVRYRVDGTLHERSPPPRHLADAIISRLKVMADLNIAERRLPQDGRLRVAVDGRLVDLRVSTLPTQTGESVVLRVLDKSMVDLSLERLGMPLDVLAAVRAVSRQPNGMFVVTGPTGSGKTTTLYSALREVNAEDTKILTAEDPVEYAIDGLVQTAINPQTGLTFAQALRSFLRQDPDKILVGEIRDTETAQIAVRAALTGHLVFATLHTNDAAGAVTRMMDLGIEGYLVASALATILAQRLVRRICPLCRIDYQPDDDERRILFGESSDSAVPAKFRRGAGCAACHDSGYSGRFGLFELIRVTESFQETIAAGSSLAELRQAARSGGMRTLREEGIAAVLRGETSVEEVLRYT